MPETLIGLDIGGTKCAVIYGRAEGDKLEIVDKTGFPTETNLGPDHTLNSIYRHIDLIIGKHKL